MAAQIIAMAGTGDFADADYAHRFLDAGRLAEADRRHSVADPEFVAVPLAALLDPQYLATRAALIPNGHALMHPRPGASCACRRAGADDPGAPTTATSQIVVVAKTGDALTMTTSLTHTFGARVAVDGVVFNNALVDFAPAPPRARRSNTRTRCSRKSARRRRSRRWWSWMPGRAGAARRQRRRRVRARRGGAGADRDPGQPPRAGRRAGPPASDSADPDHVAVESGTPAETLLPALAAMGYRARADRMLSGSAFALHDAAGWVGAADPRRDGVVAGD